MWCSTKLEILKAMLVSLIASKERAKVLNYFTQDDLKLNFARNKSIMINFTMLKIKQNKTKKRKNLRMGSQRKRMIYLT